MLDTYAPHHTSPSKQLFFPKRGEIVAYAPGNRDLESFASTVGEKLGAMIRLKNYPCMAALKSYHSDDYMIGLYKDFGTGRSWSTLREDLLFFMSEQKKSDSIYLSFFAVFDEIESSMSETEFESKLWRELSHLTSVEKRETDWPKDAINEPENPGFSFHLDGHAFFVVGLHPNSSRKGRQFFKPTLIFNVFAQFEQLEARGLYEPMIEQNRKRDMAFQGSVNPMAVAHGEKWETIQFSGKTNDSAWKCPFHFMHESEKPK